MVPVLGTEFAAAVEGRQGPWFDYVRDIVDAHDASPDRVGVFPLVAEAGAAADTELGRILARFHGIGRGQSLDEPPVERWCRDLAQGITQFLGGIAPGRLTVFISHTNKPGRGEDDHVPSLIALVRSIIGQTRLNDFFSTNDLQVGVDWDDDLRAKAATSALLALRTDLYASRPCARCSSRSAPACPWSSWTRSVAVKSAVPF